QDPRARHEHEPEARTKQEPTAEVAASATREELERALEPVADLRDDERQRRDQQRGDADLQLVLRADVQLAPDPRTREGEEREGRDEPGDDRVRAAPVVGRAAAREDDRQDGEDARRERGDHADDEGDQDEEHATHWVLLPVRLAGGFVTARLQAIPRPRASPPSALRRPRRPSACAVAWASSPARRRRKAAALPRPRPPE